MGRLGEGIREEKVLLRLLAAPQSMGEVCMWGKRGRVPVLAFGSPLQLHELPQKSARPRRGGQGKPVELPAPPASICGFLSVCNKGAEEETRYTRRH